MKFLKYSNFLILIILTLSLTSFYYLYNKYQTENFVFKLTITVVKNKIYKILNLE